MDIIEEESICLHVSDIGIIRVDEPSKLFEVQESDWVETDELYTLTINAERHGFNNPYIASLLLLRDNAYENAIPDFRVDENKNIMLVSDDVFVGRILVKGEILNA